MPDPRQSPLEKIKKESRYLAGNFSEILKNPITHFDGDHVHLIKFHGSYQQDDRDRRKELSREKKEPAYSFMVRSKITGGHLAAAQYLAHDELAGRFGDGTLRITDRQDLQFHGVAKRDLGSLLRALNEVSVSTFGACGDVVRNVMTCPAPLPDRTKSGIRVLARGLSALLAPRSGAYQRVWLGANEPHEGGEPLYGTSYLPRKFKIAVAFPGDNCVDILSQDLGLIPELEGGRPVGYHVFAGGGMGMSHGNPATFPRLAGALCFAGCGDIADVVRAVVEIYRDHGDRCDRKRARLKYLIADRGMDWLREEVERKTGGRIRPVRPVSPGPVQMHLGWHAAEEGRWFIGLSVASGRIKDTADCRLKTVLRHIVGACGCEVCLTAHQNIILNGFTDAQKSDVGRLLEDGGISLPEQLPLIRQYAMSCPALPLCGMALTEAERAMPGILDSLGRHASEAGLRDPALRVHVTGCSNGCARPYHAPLAFVGRGRGKYNLYLGGSDRADRLNFCVAENQTTEKLIEALGPVFVLYRKEAWAGESFGDFCFRLGRNALRAHLTS